ncbi:MAG: methionyl-tRNA formyltransferase, partial [Deltaproteobacteria bacterium]|nr:methionyl-tRNA formyltransferase [Deltaproteobacteria bacterium]
ILMSPLKILFMGTPSVAVPTLETLLESDSQIVGVVSQPDKPAGRGQEIVTPPVACLAKEKGLPLFQPDRVKGNAEFLKILKDLAPDVIVVVAYGKILPVEILTLPPMKCINLHFSLLPQYRGAAPVQWALINGEENTGVTTFILAEKVDAGPILLQKKVLIEPEDNTELLGHRLAIAGASLVKETLEGLKAGRLKAIPQIENLATPAPLLKKEDGKIDWSRKNTVILGQVRGMNPWPGTYTILDGKLFKIHAVTVGAGPRACPDRGTHGEVPLRTPGEIINITPEGIEIACGRESLLLTEVQLEGRKRMDAATFLAGHPLQKGQRLG